jgi:hypothetical protein
VSALVSKFCFVRPVLDDILLALKWQATMDAAIKDPKSTDYDSLIQTELTAYQARFSSWPSFPALD